MSAPVPFNPEPPIAHPALANLMRWTREHPGWRDKQPPRGVTWDARCEVCGFTIKDSTLNFTKEGRTIAQRITNRRDYNPVVCTTCIPLPGTPQWNSAVDAATS